MLDTVYKYHSLLENLNTLIDKSQYKKQHFFNELGLSRATFYNKLKKRSFSIPEMFKIGAILFPEEVKAFEIKQALERSRIQSKQGEVKQHSVVIEDARKRVNS